MKQANLFIKIPNDLKKRVTRIAHERKMQDKPNATITSVIIEFLEKSLQEYESKKESVKGTLNEV